MPKMKDGERLYKYYVNHARSAGDDPTKIISDAKRFNRHEKCYVVFLFILFQFLHVILIFKKLY